MAKTKTHEEFLEDVRNRYGDRFKVLGRYKNANTKIKIECLTCGTVRDSTPASFIRQKHGCQRCYFNEKLMTFDDIKDRIEELTNGDYSLISCGKNTREKIKIIHLVCGYEYYVDYGSFVYSGKRCRKCYGTAPVTEREFTKWFNKHMSNYIFIGDFVSLSEKITLEHKKCGEQFKVIPRSLKNNGSRCPKCRQSKGERKLSILLNHKNIIFEPQKKFEECRNISPLPFDFYLPVLNVCIEYHGIQHYKPIEFFGGVENLKRVQKHDAIKEEFCHNSNIGYEVISYKDNIKDRLDEIIVKYANHEPS